MNDKPHPTKSKTSFTQDRRGVVRYKTGGRSSKGIGDQVTGWPSIFCFAVQFGFNQDQVIPGPLPGIAYLGFICPCLGDIWDGVNP